MTQALSSQSTAYDKVSFPVLKAAADGEIDSMTLILRHYEQYICRLATVSVRGTRYINTDLYDQLKTRLIMATLKFKC
jgi:hypothetical protein